MPKLNCCCTNPNCPTFSAMVLKLQIWGIDPTPKKDDKCVYFDASPDTMHWNNSRRNAFDLLVRTWPKVDQGFQDCPRDSKPDSSRYEAAVRAAQQRVDENRKAIEQCERQIAYGKKALAGLRESLRASTEQLAKASQALERQTARLKSRRS